MAPYLRYVVVIPAGGGKTTLAQGCNEFLDIDALYNLRETESTYERMNTELQRRAATKQPVPQSVAEELRSRIERYTGSACCLLVHSVRVAESTGLTLVSILVPSAELHQASISTRDTIGKWFASQTAACAINECEKTSLHATRYSDWIQLGNVVAELLQHLHKNRANGAFSLEDGTRLVTPSTKEQERDEALLLSLCSIAVGCKFEDQR